MTGKESLVQSDELRLSCGRSLLPRDGGHLRRTTQRAAAVTCRTGQETRDPSCGTLLRCSSIESVEFSGN